MDIIVCIRQTPMLIDEIKFTADEKSVDAANLKRHINEWDLYALELALRIKAKDGAKVTAISVGDTGAEEALYYCLAAEADEGILIEREEAKYLDNWMIAKLIYAVISVRPYDLILTGLQGEDDGCAEVGGILAQLLKIPQSAVVIEIKSLSKDGSIVIQRELEDGFSDIRRVKMPALLTIQTGINQPRYVSSMRRRAIKTKSKITRIPLSDLSLDFSNFHPRKSIRRLILPEISSSKLEYIKGSTGTEQAENLIGKLTEKGLF